jgi:monovalent cation/proton antiporter MnhG/PhaG subunit
VSVRDLAEYVLLALGGGIQVLSALGVLAMRNAFERLHYVATAGVGAALVCIAVTVRESFSLIGNKAFLLAVFFIASGPVLVHATARAARVRGEDGWGVKESEVEEP